MMFGVMANVVAISAICLVTGGVSGTASAPCPSSTVALNVTSTADVQNLTNALACTGEGAFDIKWKTSLTIAQAIEVSNNKDVTVTGTNFPSIHGALSDENGGDASTDTGAGRGTGLFTVSNGSTLRLNRLVLEGGNAENGGAVELQSSSSLFVFDCTFANNNAHNGGEKICSCIANCRHVVFEMQTASVKAKIYRMARKIALLWDEPR